MSSVNSKSIILEHVKSEPCSLNQGRPLSKVINQARAHKHTDSCMHLPTEVTKIQGLQRNAVISRTLLQRTNDFYHLKKKTFGPHNIQIRGSLHSLLLFSNCPHVKSKKKRREKKVLRRWNECISIGKRKEHCQLKYSFITKSRVKRYTQFPTRNRGDGRHYLEGEEKILCGNKFLKSPGFKTMQ